MKITGLYPRVRVDTSATAAIGQAGGVPLIRTVAVTGLDRLLSAALSRWRKPLAIHDPGEIINDLALSLALGGDCLADLACCVPSRASTVASSLAIDAALRGNSPAWLRQASAYRHRYRSHWWNGDG